MEVSIFLIPIISILLYKCCLKYYSIKDPRLSENDKKNIEENFREQEFLLYFFNILFSLCITFLLYYHFGIIGLFPIFIIGLSIIFRVIKKMKISNILCGIIVAPAMVIIVFNTFYTVLVGDYEPIFLSSNDTECGDLMKATFNQKFLQYEGEKVNGAKVRALINLIKSNNENPEIEGSKITLNLNGENENDMPEASSKIIDTRRYKVYCEYNNDGYIKEIKITQSKNNVNT